MLFKLSKNVTAAVLVFLIGFLGAATFNEVAPQPVCEGPFYGMSGAYVYDKTAGAVTEDRAVADVTRGLNVDTPQHSVNTADAPGQLVTAVGRHVVAKDGSNVVAFEVIQNEHGRFVANNFVVCLDGNGEPLDTGLDVSDFPSLADPSEYVSEAEFNAEQSEDQ